MENLETINPFTLAPWEKRMQTIVVESAAKQADLVSAVRIAVNSSSRNGVVGIGGAIEILTAARSERRLETFSSTLGTRAEQNPYSGELEAMASALSSLPKLRYRNIVLLTRNKGAVFALS
jgi:hypothetical protein